MIYSTEGHVGNTVRAVLKDVGADFRLTNDLVWENATITHTTIHDGNSVAGKDPMTGTVGENDIFIIDTTGNAFNGADVIRNFKDGEDKVKINALDGDVARLKSVTWVKDNATGDIYIFAANPSSGPKTSDNTLAIIEGFDGTFDANDFEPLQDLNLIAAP